MKTNEKLRQLREMQDWTQEEMAEKMQMSASGYAKLERGDNNLNIERLEQIAQIFNIDIADLTSQGKGIIFVVGGDYGDNNSISHYGTTESIIQELEKTKLTLSHKEEIIDKLNEQIVDLRELVKLLKAKC